MPWPRPAEPAPILPYPSRPPVRHREQCTARAAGQRERPQARVRAGVITGADGAEARPVRRRVRTRTSVPSSAPAFSGRFVPMVTAPGQPAPGAPARPAPARGPAALPGGPGRARSASPRPPCPRPPPRPRPRDQRQVPGQRRDHVPGALPGHERHQHDHPDHELPGQQPFPFPLHEPGAQRRLLPSRSRTSSTIFTARSRSSSGYFRCATMTLHPPRFHSL